MRLSEVHWITPDQLKVLAEHRVLTLGELASFELADSMANTIPVDGLRALARRARASLGHPDPMEQLGASVGQRGPVKYAGYQTYGGKG